VKTIRVRGMNVEVGFLLGLVGFGRLSCRFMLRDGGELR
jgi:hypothetical protein